MEFLSGYIVVLILPIRILCSKWKTILFSADFTVLWFLEQKISGHVLSLAWPNWPGHRRHQAQYRKPNSKMSLFKNKCPR